MQKNLQLFPGNVLLNHGPQSTVGWLPEYIHLHDAEQDPSHRGQSCHSCELKKNVRCLLKELDTTRLSKYACVLRLRRNMKHRNISS